jgi:GNAT superfamily N-acetyltransferase
VQIGAVICAILIRRLKGTASAPLWSQKPNPQRQALGCSLNIERKKANHQDMGLLYELNRRAMKEHTIENFGHWDESEQRQSFEDSTDISAHELLFDGEIPFGFINMYEHEHELHINRLCIVPEYQSRGIGTALLTELIISNPPERPIRLQVFLQNPAANLYRRLGFKETKVTPTHIHMVYMSNVDR